MASSNINIKLKAIDEYSGVLTGLNQGLELVGKGFNFIKATASVAWDAISYGTKAALDLAKVGGAFQEQRNQFENLAKSYKVNGQSIIDTVKGTALNTITEFDSISIATKALAAGLKGKDLEDSLSYVKRWTEATGQDFRAVSESVFTSLASGRFSILRQMGLVIENGAKLNQVVAAMSAGLKKFGDSGFNAGDKLASMAASQDDFWRKIGQGVNSSKEFQDVLTRLSDNALAFVKNFDPLPVTLFVDEVISGAKNIYNIFKETFPGVSKLLDTMFVNPIEGVKDFAKVGVDSFYAIYRTAADVTNSILETFKTLNSGNVLSDLASGTIQLLSFIGSAISQLIESAVDLAADAIARILNNLGDFLKQSPKISEWLGIDASVFDFSGSANQLKTSVAAMTGAFKLGFDDLSKRSDALFSNLNGGFDDMKSDLSEIDKAHVKTLSSLDSMSKSYSKANNEAEKMAETIKNVPSYSKIKVELADGSVKEIEDGLKYIKAPLVNLKAELDLNELKDIDKKNQKQDHY